MGAVWSDVADDVFTDAEDDVEEDEKAKTKKTEKKKLLLEEEDCFQDAADVLRWSASGKDAAEKRLAAENEAAEMQRFVFAFALLLPPFAVAVVDGAGSANQLAAWAGATVKHFTSYVHDPLWIGAALALSVERVCCKGRGGLGLGIGCQNIP